MIGTPTKCSEKREGCITWSFCEEKAMGALVLGDAGKEEGSWLLHLFSVNF